MNHIYLNPLRTIAPIDRNIFGGFAEHMARCVYEGIYDPDSPLADEHGLRPDVIEALRRLKMPLVRYPGGNFVSGYRWQDGVGPRNERPPRLDLAWHHVDSNHFGTNEFVEFCRRVETEPFLVVNCGDGDMREARDWVEYCNGPTDSAMGRLRAQHGYDAPHRRDATGASATRSMGTGRSAMKTPDEYARAFTEFGKVMKWVDPTIKLVASADFGLEWSRGRTPALPVGAGWQSGRLRGYSLVRQQSARTILPPTWRIRRCSSSA